MVDKHKKLITLIIGSIILAIRYFTSVEPPNSILIVFLMMIILMFKENE